MWNRSEAISCFVCRRGGFIVFLKGKKEIRREVLMSTSANKPILH